MSSSPTGFGRRHLIGLGGGLALSAASSRPSSWPWPLPTVHPPPDWAPPRHGPSKPPLPFYGLTVEPYNDLDAGKVKFRNHITPSAHLSEFNWAPGQDLVIAFGACPNGAPRTVTPLVTDTPTLFFLLGDLVDRDGADVIYRNALQESNTVLWEHYEPGAWFATGEVEWCRRAHHGAVATVRIMRIEPLSARHQPALVNFVSAIAERDRVFVDRTLISQVKIASWTQAVPERRLVAVDDDGSVSGLLTVSRGTGWSSHTADVRVIVRSSARGRGVGRALASAGVDLAGSMGIEKLSVETMAANAGGRATFAALGFAVEARLPGGIRDDAGQLQDIVILSRWLSPGADGTDSAPGHSEPG